MSPTKLPRLPTLRSHVTLALCTILHGFTHAYGSMLVPLYTRMQADLHLPYLRRASLVVTLYGAVYSLGSYAGGVLTDRCNRKALLGIGLLGNAVAMTAMGLTHSYLAILLLGIAAGAFGTVFHPAANALAAAHYPREPGMAIGLLGIGAGLGFFAGPQIAGWRAQTAHWHFAAVSDWQRPCIELGVLGLLVGVIFLFVAHDPAPTGSIAVPTPLGKPLRGRIMALAALLMFRDFAGVAMTSLAALYAQKAFGKTVQQAGLIVGLMMVPSMICSPLAVYLSRGRRRLPTLAAVLIVGGVSVFFTPLWPTAWLLLPLCLFQTLQLGSYALSDGAMLERVSPAVRGRVVGMFLVIAGTFGSLGPWGMGAWVDFLGPRAASRFAYFGPFALLGIFMLAASSGVVMLRRLGPPLAGAEIGPFEETSPRNIEPGM